MAERCAEMCRESGVPLLIQNLSRFTQSDPYVRVLVNNIVQARTEVVNNSMFDSQEPVDENAYLLTDLNPHWDEIIYTPVHSLKETLLLEVMDYQNLTKDRSLGTVELKVSELAQEIPKGEGSLRFSFESTGKKDRSEPIRLDRGNQYKGHLHYVAEFLPAFTLQGLKFKTDPNELQSAVEDSDEVHDDSGSASSSSSEEQVERAITTTEPIGVPRGARKDVQHADATHAVASTNATVVNKTVSSREGSPSSGKTHSTDGKNEGIRMSNDELLTHRRWWSHFKPLLIYFDYRVRDHHLPRQIGRAFQERSLGSPP